MGLFDRGDLYGDPTFQTASCADLTARAEKLAATPAEYSYMPDSRYQVLNNTILAVNSRQCGTHLRFGPGGVLIEESLASLRAGFNSAAAAVGGKIFPGALPSWWSAAFALLIIAAVALVVTRHKRFR